MKEKKLSLKKLTIAKLNDPYRINGGTENQVVVDNSISFNPTHTKHGTNVSSLDCVTMGQGGDTQDGNGGTPPSYTTAPITG